MGFSGHVVISTIGIWLAKPATVIKSAILLDLSSTTFYRIIRQAFSDFGSSS